MMRASLLLFLAAVMLAAPALAQDEIVFKNYNLKHIDLKDGQVRQKIEDELAKVMSPKGRYILDERTNTIIVQDSEKTQNEVARILAKLDVGKEDNTKTTITIRVANIEASEARKALEEAIEKDKELRGLTISHSDETCAVMITGTAKQLEKAKALIDALEEKFRSEVETAVYKIKNRSAASLADIVKLHLPGAPGTGVAIDEVTNSLIVRETKANQSKVKGVIEKFDTELRTLLLQFTVIYASREGSGVDESIKDVVKELQKNFEFTSYRAQEGPLVKVEQGHPAKVEDSGSGVGVALARCDYDADTGKIRIEGLEVSKRIDQATEKPSSLTISTTVKVQAGHTLVIGGATSKDAAEALIVVVKASVQE
jgi:type II secretory pathway component GspD/PulD (secretin)